MLPHTTGQTATICSECSPRASEPEGTMPYVVQAIAFLVAVASQFFEAVKKDAKGKSSWRNGHPELTKSGRVIFVLLILSSIAAVITTGRDRKDSEEKHDAVVKLLNAVQRQNNNLQAQNEELRKQNQAHFGENLRKLEELQQREEELGLSTARKINKSASTLL